MSIDHRSLHRLILGLVGLAWFLMTAPPAAAEWFADLYGGAAGTERSDVTLVVNPPSGPANHTFHNVKWDISATVGGRAGYWFERFPWYGIGLDVFHFNADIPTQTVSLTIPGATVPATLQEIDFSITAIAFDVIRLRLPLRVSPEFPKGQLQPYLTVGPALFLTRATNKTNAELTTQTATDTSLGVKVGAGASWQLFEHVAVFGEYRFTHFRAEPVLNSALSSLRVPLQSDLNTHHLLAGISWRF
ncbi:MAG: porin family protein [Nitrospirae bacterium]|nr:MAG: porin family protein [Nitrospirota bacterium]